jgi:hypothetical protein
LAVEAVKTTIAVEFQPSESLLWTTVVTGLSLEQTAGASRRYTHVSRRSRLTDTRVVDMDGVDARCSVESQLQSITDDRLMVRKLLVETGLSIASVMKQKIDHDRVSINIPENLCTPTVASVPESVTFRY